MYLLTRQWTLRHFLVARTHPPPPPPENTD